MYREAGLAWLERQAEIAGDLAVELLEETPLVPVVVRYDPAIRGPHVAHGSAPGGAAPRAAHGRTPSLPTREAVRMDERSTRVAGLLHEAAETHHQVFRITDGADDDWASWYAEWLVTLSELPELLGGNVVRSELTCLLVRLDKEYTERRVAEHWEDFYARELVGHFRPS
jgi:hypothetical protein